MDFNKNKSDFEKRKIQLIVLTGIIHTYTHRYMYIQEYILHHKHYTIHRYLCCRLCTISLGTCEMAEFGLWTRSQEIKQTKPSKLMKKNFQTSGELNLRPPITQSIDLASGHAAIKFKRIHKPYHYLNRKPVVKELAISVNIHSNWHNEKITIYYVCMVAIFCSLWSGQETILR